MGYLIKTTKKNRSQVIDKLTLLGEVQDRWDDGTFSFAPSDNVCTDDMEDICEDFGVEAELV